MNINLHYQSVAPEVIDQLIREARDNPDVVSRYLYPHPSEVSYSLLGPRLSLERNWSTLYSILDQGWWQRFPRCCEAMLGGAPVGWHVCYAEEPARYMRVEQIKEIAVALSEVTDTVLHDEMNYFTLFLSGALSGECLSDKDARALQDAFRSVRDFYAEVYRIKYEILIWIC